MTVWVTGASGFIGRHLVRALADDGQDVHGIGYGAIEEVDRQRLGLENWLNGEIGAMNLDALAARSGLPSVIFHLAGGSSVGLSIAQPLDDFSRTVVGTARLLEWLRGSGIKCRLITASSAAVYGSEHRGPISEAAAPAPMSPYGHHKRMMERLCESYAVSFGLPSTVVRLFSVYGSGLRKQLLWDVCSRLRQGERILTLGGTGAEVRDWTHVRDVVGLLAGVSKLPQQANYQIVNGGSGLGTTVADIAGLVVDNWDGDVAVNFSGMVRAGDPFSLVADDTQLRGIPFVWRTPVAQGVAEYVRWFKEQAR